MNIDKAEGHFANAFDIIANNVPDDPILVKISPLLWLCSETIRQYVGYAAEGSWDEGFEAGVEWLKSQHGNPCDPTPNPYLLARENERKAREAKGQDTAR